MHKVLKVFAFIGGLAIVIMILATVVDVFCRKAIGQSYPGATEIVSYLLTAVVYFGVGYCAMERGMITIDLFKQSKVAMVICNVLSIVVGFVVVYATIIQSMQSMAVGGSSMRLSIPRWPFMLITALGFLFMSVILILQTIEDLRKKPSVEAADAPQISEEEGKEQ